MERGAVLQALQEAASCAIDAARSAGADAAEASASYEEGLAVTVRLGEVESVERQRDRGLGITVYHAGRKGSASTADLAPAAIRATVEKAASIAQFTTADPFAGLADPALLAKAPPELDLYHPWEIDVDDAAALALRSEQAARGFDSRIANSEGATVSSGGGVRVYASSSGFCEGYPTTSHSVSCSVVAKDGDALERDYWYTAARRAAELDAPEDVGREASRRAVARLGARALTTRTLPVLFPAENARGLFGHLLAAIRGRSQYRRASFLLDAVGRAVFSDIVTLREDPHIPRAFGSAPFDAEGVATRSRVLVERGTLQGYLLSSYSARRLGMTTTGNAGGAHTILVEPTTTDMGKLMGDIPELFVVGELLGQGVNLVTGDYSRGVAGFLLRHGEVVHAVSEVTLAGNLMDMYRRVAAIGSDINRCGSIHTGSVLVEGMTLAGQ
jgi:PmbA protein